MPGAIRVILFYDAGLFFDDFGLGTRAGHGRAEEHVDDEHNQEEDAESDAQIEQPQRLNTRTSSHCKWGSSRIDDVDTVGGHQTPLRVGYIAANGSTLGERSDVVVTECFAAPAFANEDVALNVDDIVFGETVHRDFSLGVTFVVIDEICGDLLLWAPSFIEQWNNAAVGAAVGEARRWSESVKTVKIINANSELVFAAVDSFGDPLVILAVKSHVSVGRFVP